MNLQVRKPQIKKKTVVSSYGLAVTIGDKPVIIGERINPTGKAKFKQALREHDMEYIYKEGIMQQEKGADILDVNVGLPEIDEPAMMEEAIKGLQAVTNLPLQIDTTNIEAMERALRVYCGKPILNSVSGKQSSMEKVFPLAKKYGAVVVGLCLDEHGIPETAEGRVEIARKIIKAAAEYGIDKKDLLIDTLTLTVSTGAQNAQVTLEALTKVRKELNVQTCLGVSNVSFGLPERTRINTAFYTLALQSGLSAGIVNPASDEMMAAYYAYNALAGFDTNCAEYIARSVRASSVPASSVPASSVPASSMLASSAPTSSVPASSVPASSMPTSSVPTSSVPVDSATVVVANEGGILPLKDAITRGLAQSAAKATQMQLEAGAESMQIINQELVPALDEVGKGFESGKIFLPQLLMSAEAARCAFEVIKKYLLSQGRREENKGSIIIATVKGDIHDIGKNIVKVLLENYGFEVIDLGKDVAPEQVLGAARQYEAKLVGLSALMTTTVASMEATIKLLKKECAACKIMVGGAVLTQEYADMIGADFYSADAMGAVRYAQMIYQGGI